MQPRGQSLGQKLISTLSTMYNFETGRAGFEQRVLTVVLVGFSLLCKSCGDGSGVGYAKAHSVILQEAICAPSVVGEHGWDHLITFDRDGDDHHDPITITIDRDDDEREKVKSCKNQHFSSKKCQL